MRPHAQHERSTAIDPNYAGTWSNLGLLLRQVGEVQASRSAFERSLQLDPKAAAAHNGLGLALHYQGDPVGAIPHYDRALALDPNFAEAMYNRGVSQMHAGAVQAAAQSYFLALELKPDYVEAMINLASVHHRHGSLDMARQYYGMALGVAGASVDDQIMVHTNLGVTYVMDYDGERALAHFGEARALLQLQREVLLGEARAVASGSGSTYKNASARATWKHQDVTIASVETELRANTAHFSRTRTAQCDWELYWPRLYEIFAECDAEMMRGKEASLLPFDTLLLPTPSSAWTLRVARSHSVKWEGTDKYAPMALDPALLPVSTASSGDGSRRDRLRIGYVSHDFNDHPTAHMAEGLFEHHDTTRYAVTAYSYGKNDESVFRARIESAVESFVEMAALDFVESAQLIRDDRLHVLFDLQCHTRGNRIEITAVKPAPIIVNFLIYPGPMGAAWIDYLVADAVVTPVEHARHSYLSKLLLMPVTYQVNYYPREDYVRIGADDRINGDQQKQAPSPKRAAVDPRFEDAIDIDEDDPCLPCRTASFVFCNFNKNDKQSRALLYG